MSHNRFPIRNQQFRIPAYTFIEILVVLIILALIAGIVGTGQGLVDRPAGGTVIDDDILALGDSDRVRLSTRVVAVNG